METDQIIQTISTYVSLYGIKIIASIIIFIIGKWIVKALTKFVTRLMSKANVDETLSQFVANITYTVLLIFVVLAALNNLGINTTSFVAILGAAGLAIGLALQGSLANLGAGVLLIIFRPFKKGDFVDAGGAMGTVQEISIFNTTLTSPDNRVIIVPNSNIIGGNITNFSGKETRRIDLVFGVGYSDDLKLVKQELIDIVQKAIEHKGFSVVEVLTQCPTYYGRRNKAGDAPEMIANFKESTTGIGSKAKAENPDLIERGIFVEEDRPEYCSEYDKVIETARKGT